MMTEKMFDRINEIIGKAGKIIVSGHIMPDGDAMGSSLAMASILRRIGKEVSVFKEDPFPFNYLFLKGSNDFISTLPEDDPDLFIILDSGSPERVGKTLFERLQATSSPVVLFDHHVQSDEKKAFYTEAIVDNKACATAALIYRWSVESEIRLNKAEAEAIYAAIMSDTGGLRYGSTNREAFNILGELVDEVDPWEVASNMYENVSEEQLRLLAEVLSDMRIISGGKAAVIRITLKQLAQYSLRPDHVEGFVNFARSVKGVQLAVRFREESENRWKASIRSKGGINSSLIAEEFGGGGHVNAAGFYFEGSYEEGLKKIGEIVDRVAR